MFLWSYTIVSALAYEGTFTNALYVGSSGEHCLVNPLLHLLVVPLVGEELYQEVRLHGVDDVLCVYPEVRGELRQGVLELVL